MTKKSGNNILSRFLSKKCFFKKNPQRFSLEKTFLVSFFQDFDYPSTFSRQIRADFDRPSSFSTKIRQEWNRPRALTIQILQEKYQPRSWTVSNFHSIIHSGWLRSGLAVPPSWPDTIRRKYPSPYRQEMKEVRSKAECKSGNVPLD